MPAEAGAKQVDALVIGDSYADDVDMGSNGTHTHTHAAASLEEEIHFLL